MSHCIVLYQYEMAPEKLFKNDPINSSIKEGLLIDTILTPVFSWDTPFKYANTLSQKYKNLVGVWAD
jgi:hypothetical protein